uniref:Uncharacterized protein n=1 Tax=Arundo donax TaxID=35708 RepID=A0A0A9AY65_ARUDO
MAVQRGIPSSRTTALFITTGTGSARN